MTILSHRSSCFINPFMKKITTNKITEDFSLLFASTNTGHYSAPKFLYSITVILSFSVFLRSSTSHTGHVLPDYAWVRFSLGNPWKHKSCQSQLSGHCQNGFSIHTQGWWLVWLITFWLIFPDFCLGHCFLPRAKGIKDHLFLWRSSQLERKSYSL